MNSKIDRESLQKEGLGNGATLRFFATPESEFSIDKRFRRNSLNDSLNSERKVALL